MSTIVGVISDTHGLLRPAALQALKNSDFIIHAGDTGDPEILVALRKLAPVTVVRGNIDRGEWALTIPVNDVLEAGGASIYVLHNRDDLDLKPKAAGFAAVIYGHTHKPKQEIEDGVLYFNPGSAGPRRFDLPVSVGRLIISRGKIKGEIIQMEV